MTSDSIRPPTPTSLDVFGLIPVNDQSKQRKNSKKRKRKPPQASKSNDEVVTDNYKDKDHPHIDVYS